MAKWSPDRSHRGETTCPGFDPRAKPIRPQHILQLQVAADLTDKMARQCVDARAAESELSARYSACGFLEITVLLTFFAVVGKIAGTALTARMTGESWRFSLGLGALAQAKGLMEIVVATILLDVKVISPTIFSAVLVMALISTTLAMPMTRLTLARHGTRGLA